MVYMFGPDFAPGPDCFNNLYDGRRQLTLIYSDCMIRCLMMDSIKLKFETFPPDTRKYKYPANFFHPHLNRVCINDEMSIVGSFTKPRKCTKVNFT